MIEFKQAVKELIWQVEELLAAEAEINLEKRKEQGLKDGEFIIGPNFRKNGAYHQTASALANVKAVMGNVEGQHTSKSED